VAVPLNAEKIRLYLLARGIVPPQMVKYGDCWVILSPPFDWRDILYGNALPYQGEE
jgi:hypothetical protein